jgi:O-antigen/teichoic acid export membrane protein
VKSLFAQIGTTSAARLFNLIAGLVALSITARWLGPEGRGMVIMVTTMASGAATLGGLSLWQVVYRHATNKDEQEWLPPFLGLCACLCIAVTVIAAVASYFFVFAAKPEMSLGLWLLGLALLPLLLIDQLGSAILQTLNQLSKYNLATVIGRCVGLAILPIALIVWGWGEIGALVATVAAQLVISLFILLAVLREAGAISMPAFVTFRGLMSAALVLHINAVGTFMFSGGDILIVGYHAGEEQVAFYQLTTQLMNVIMILPQAAVMVFYQHLSQVGAAKGWRQQRTQIALVLAIVVAGGVFAALTAEFWITLVAGQEFGPSVEIFRYQLINLVGMSFALMMTPQWISQGMYWQTSVIALLVGSTVFVLTQHWVPENGAIGAVFAKWVAYALAILINVIMFVRCNNQLRQAAAG